MGVQPLTYTVRDCTVTITEGRLEECIPGTTIPYLSIGIEIVTSSTEVNCEIRYPTSSGAVTNYMECREVYDTKAFDEVFIGFSYLETEADGGISWVSDEHRLVITYDGESTSRLGLKTTLKDMVADTVGDFLFKHILDIMRAYNRIAFRPYWGNSRELTILTHTLDVIIIEYDDRFMRFINNGKQRMMLISNNDRPVIIMKAMTGTIEVHIADETDRACYSKALLSFKLDETMMSRPSEPIVTILDAITAA